MSSNIPSTFAPTYAPTYVSANPATNTTAPSPMPVSQPSDSLTLSAQATANAGTPATPASPVLNGTTNANVTQQLMQLQSELVQINQQIETIMASLPAQQQPAAPVTTAALPAPTVAPTAAAATTAASTASGGTYTVQTGDYLWKIAQSKLGDASRWQEIYNLNKATIGANPNLLYPGEVLKLPPTTPSSSPAATVTSANSPVPTIPATPAPATATTTSVDVPLSSSNLPALSAQQIASIAQNFGLSPDATNVQTFMNEMNSYETTEKGKVFGPGMESLASTPAEQTTIKQSVMQIQQALNLMIQSGKLHPKLPNGQPVTQLPLSGTFFQVDSNGNPVKDANGNPVEDPAFVAAVTQYKQDQGIHQNYKLADGSYAVNEYVGPVTIEHLKQSLLGLQGTATPGATS